VVLTLSPPHGTQLNENGVFGGDCGADGSLKVVAAHLSRCTLTLYPLVGRYTLGTGPAIATRTVQVTERLAPAPGENLGAAQQLLCQTSFQVGLVSTSTIDHRTPAISSCKQSGEPGPAGDTSRDSAVTNLALSVTKTAAAGPLRFGVADDFKTPGYITTYSDGCSPLAAGGAAYAVGDPLTCTITHTYVGTATTAKDGLLEIDTRSRLGAPSAGRRSRSAR
jgi:hypothetical protein